jgi:hypothetical protein
MVLVALAFELLFLSNCSEFIVPVTVPPLLLTSFIVVDAYFYGLVFLQEQELVAILGLGRAEHREDQKTRNLVFSHIAGVWRQDIYISLYDQ